MNELLMYSALGAGLIMLGILDIIALILVLRISRLHRSTRRQVETGLRMNRQAAELTKALNKAQRSSNITTTRNNRFGRKEAK